MSPCKLEKGKRRQERCDEMRAGCHHCNTTCNWINLCTLHTQRPTLHTRLQRFSTSVIVLLLSRRSAHLSYVMVRWPRAAWRGQHDRANDRKLLLAHGAPVLHFCTVHAPPSSKILIIYCADDFYFVENQARARAKRCHGHIGLRHSFDIASPLVA